MSKVKEGEKVIMVSLAEGCMLAGRGRHAMTTMIQRGIVRGAYDPTRSLGEGRWKVAREDCMRIREQDATQRANVAAR